MACGQRSDNVDESHPNFSLATVLMLSTVRARRFLTLGPPPGTAFQARAVSPQGAPPGRIRRGEVVMRAGGRPLVEPGQGRGPTAGRVPGRAATGRWRVQPRRILKSLARSRLGALACRRVRGLIRRDLDAPSVLAAM